MLKLWPEIGPFNAHRRKEYGEDTAICGDQIFLLLLFFNASASVVTSDATRRLLPVPLIGIYIWLAAWHQSGGPG